MSTLIHAEADVTRLREYARSVQSLTESFAEFEEEERRHRDAIECLGESEERRRFDARYAKRREDLLSRLQFAYDRGMTYVAGSE